MRTWVVAYIASAAVFLGLDAAWLSLAGQRLYRPLLGGMLLPRFSAPPAILFYLIYVAGIVVLAISPALAAGRWRTASLHGALLGLVAYATYDLTNQATLRHWPVLLTWVDLLWGTTLTTVAATLGYCAARALA